MIQFSEPFGSQTSASLKLVYVFRLSPERTGWDEHGCTVRSSRTFLCQRVGQLRGLSANTNYSSTTTVSKRAPDGAARHSCFHRKALVPFSLCFCAPQFWCRPSKHPAAQPAVPPAGSKVQMTSRRSEELVPKYVSVAECESVRPQQLFPSQNTRFYCNGVAGQNLKPLRVQIKTADS